MKTVSEWADEILDGVHIDEDHPSFIIKGLNKAIKAIRQEAVEECIKRMDKHLDMPDGRYGLIAAIRRVGEE